MKETDRKTGISGKTEREAERYKDRKKRETTRKRER